MDKSILKIRIILWLILAVIIGWFGYMKIVPTGKISYENNFDKPNFFIGKLTPAERVVINQGSTEVKGEPVYFSLTTPRRFEQAKVTVKFKNTTDWPVMEIGLLNNKITGAYDLKPLQNKIIDQLSLVWPVVYGSDGSRLIEREKKFDTIENFLSDLPARTEIALYDYNLKNKFLLAKYEPKPQAQLINYNFRGAYQFYTYIKNEDLEYTFNFTDLNINKDNDPVDIKVYSPDGLIYNEHMADDTASSPERQANFNIPNLPEGVYRISFEANDDIITKAITSKQSQFALINKVWLASGNKPDLILYTDSRLVSAQTINPASLGKIKVGSGAIDLSSTYNQFSLRTADQSTGPLKSGLAGPDNGQENGIVKIELAKDDIIIFGDGVFSFNENSLFDPRFKNLDQSIDINREGINYILTNYKSPLKSMDWLTVTADFDLTKAYQEKGKYQFLISVPGLKADAVNAGAVIIKEIKIDLAGTSLWQKFNKYLNR